MHTLSDWISAPDLDTEAKNPLPGTKRRPLVGTGHGDELSSSSPLPVGTESNTPVEGEEAVMRKSFTDVRARALKQT